MGSFPSNPVAPEVPQDGSPFPRLSLSRWPCHRPELTAAQGATSRARQWTHPVALLSPGEVPEGSARHPSLVTLAFQESRKKRSLQRSFKQQEGWAHPAVVQLPPADETWAPLLHTCWRVQEEPDEWPSAGGRKVESLSCG